MHSQIATAILNTEVRNFGFWRLPRLVWLTLRTESLKKRMLRIQSSEATGQIVFALSGRMDEEDIAGLESLIRSEANRGSIVLDLKGITLVGREAVSFFGRCEAHGIILRNCAAYVREWIARERRGGGSDGEPTTLGT